MKLPKYHTKTVYKLSIQKKQTVENLKNRHESVNS